MISAVLTVACFLAVISLLTTGEILGWSLPLDVPAWVTILALVAVYAMVTVPLRAVRNASYEALGPRRGWFVFWDGVLWLALVILGGWIAAHYVPGVGDSSATWSTRRTASRSTTRRRRSAPRPGS